MGNIVTTASNLKGGVTAVAGVAMAWRFELGGTWAAGDYASLIMTARLTANSELVGYGPATGIRPVFLKTWKRKLYLVAGTSLYFSALDQPEVLNKLNQPGNSFIEMANEYGFADDLLAAAIFRRQMAILGRQHIQIWNIDPDPAQNSQSQTLENEGTVNGASVRGLGTMDVLYCADSGVRSLAARANSEDAVVNDLGTPIDSLIQAALDTYGSAGICSIVEPRTRRYWLAIGTTIYVFSYFPSSGIAAWSKYTASVTTEGNEVLPLNVGSQYVYTVTEGTLYKWTKGINDGVLTCGTTTLSASGYFIADATTATIAQGATGTLTAMDVTTFTPEKFEVFNGQIFVRSTAGKIYRYGGTNNATYDASVCTWKTPWLDARTAGTVKPARAVDTAMEGAWLIKMGFDSSSNNPLKPVLRHTDSTFKLGSITTDGAGTHFMVQGQSITDGYARLGMFLYHFERGNER